MRPRRPRTIELAAVLVASALAASACSSSEDAAPTSTSDAPTTTEQTPDSTTETTEDLMEDDPSDGETGSRFDTTDGFEAVDCELLTNEVVATEVLSDDSIECGYVTVPADWETPDGDQIQIAAYLIPTTSDSPAADPVVYLEGGPGGAGVLAVGDFAQGAASYLRERGDVIVIDQRGTGYSVPALYCPEVNDEEDSDVAGHQACRDRLVADGVNPADYNSVNNARDLTAVREALGYDEWNLYGLSYGTRLALTAMRDEPDGIRSVILDSVFPVEVNGISESGYTLYWAIDQIAANCEADSDCDVDAKAAIEDGIQRLTETPIDGLAPLDYLSVITEMIAEPELMQIITNVAEGSEADIGEMVAELTMQAEEEELPPISEVDPSFYPVFGDAAGMGYSVVCAEEVPYLDATAGPTLGDDFRPTTQAVVKNGPKPFDPAACSVWDVPPAGDIATQAVTSDIPTLVLAGTADIATPPAWSRLTSETLANATYLEFPGLTHGLVGNNDCLNGLTAQFLDDPTAELDQACVAAFPAVDYQAD